MTLPRDTELALVARWQAGDREAGGILVATHERLIRRAARRYWRQPVDAEDYRQEARIGFLLGCSSFDPARGTRLATHCWWQMRSELRAYYDDTATLIRVAGEARLGGGREKIQRAAGVAAVQPLCIDLPVRDTERLLRDLIAGDEPSAVDRVIDAQEHQRLAAGIASLSPRYSLILRRRIAGEETLAQIGDSLGMTRERVRQIEAEALEALRRRMEAA